ncbi:MAG TPA: hypothetical protein VFQ35_28755 [Polyangiaceae bacterium]|nr:hypothetical protein [Polyangiaceae bacterium]
MRNRWVVSLCLAVMLGTPLSFAQGKRGKPAAPAKAPPAAAPARPIAEEKERDKDKPPAPAEEKPAAEAPPGSDPELGAPPPKAAEGASTTPISPLTPAPDEFVQGPPPAAPADFDKLLGDIAALRSRVAAVTTTLFKSRLRVVLESRADDARIEALAITLDDGVVFAAPERFSADDDRVVYEHAVAPGSHVLGIDVERYDARARQYRTWQNSRFSVVVPESQLVEAHFRIEDSSDMASDFPSDQDGEYKLVVRLRARVTSK